MNANPNDMAYPVLDMSQTPNGTQQLGLTKREYFTGIAMQGAVAGLIGKVALKWEEAAFMSVAFADALIAELNKEQQP